MNLGFSEIIRAIESELKFEYMGDAIVWCDENFHGAWSASLNRFESSLVLAIERKDYMTAKIEGDFYKNTILDLLSKYKINKNINDTESFLSSITQPGDDPLDHEGKK